MPEKSKRATSSVDEHIGLRLQKLRKHRSMSLEALAKSTGLVTYQQIQKYEKGSNRISAANLFLLSNILGVEPTYFFEGLTDPLTGKECTYQRPAGSL